MFKRLQKLTESNSFILFGPRGTGKSTLLNQLLGKGNTALLWIDLLDPDLEAEYLLNPGRLLERWHALSQKPDWVVIDEIQKVPKLLDVVHLGIEKHGIRFALTGSSARKLKRGAANLLAGRAFIFKLHPLMSLEVGDRFVLDDALQFGTLPRIYSLNSAEEKSRFLRSYAQTYLKEEIQVEQAVRKIEPFRKFLDVAAQSNGEILNYSRLGREAGIESKNVERYFEILSDTLLGFFLDAYHTSIRKRQTQKPKFYFFDPGVCRAIQGLTGQPLTPRTSAYGKAFEHWVILECIRMNDYLEKDFRFSYLRTKDGVEIDLIVERPGRGPVLIEIKSTSRVDTTDLAPLKSLRDKFKSPECLVLSQEKHPRVEDDVLISNWREGISRIFRD